MLGMLGSGSSFPRSRTFQTRLQLGGLLRGHGAGAYRGVARGADWFEGIFHAVVVTKLDAYQANSQTKFNEAMDIIDGTNLAKATKSLRLFNGFRRTPPPAYSRFFPQLGFALGVLTSLWKGLDQMIGADCPELPRRAPGDFER